MGSPGGLLSCRPSQECTSLLWVPSTTSSQVSPGFLFQLLVHLSFSSPADWNSAPFFCLCSWRVSAASHKHSDYSGCNNAQGAKQLCPRHRDLMPEWGALDSLPTSVLGLPHHLKQAMRILTPPAHCPFELCSALWAHAALTPLSSHSYAYLHCLTQGWPTTQLWFLSNPVPV